MALKQSIVSDIAAGSVAPPTVGMQIRGTVDTTEAELDVASYKGRYVHLYCEDVDLYFAFFVASGGALSFTSTTVSTGGVPGRVDQGGAGVHFVVPTGATYMVYRSVSGAGGSFTINPS